MKYILNGIEFKPNNVGIFIGNYSKGHNPIVLAESELIALGATPVDSELNKKHSTGDSTCEKCGETEGIELCPKCGAESYGNCPCKPKEEKIEIKLPKKPQGNVSEAYSLEYVGDCILYLANKLNKGDN